MGGKTTAGPMMPYQASQSTVSIPPEVLARYNAVNARAEQVASQPFQAYGGQFVAGLTPIQQAGSQAITAAQGMAQPGYQAGMGYTQQGQGLYGQASQMAGQAGASRVANMGIADISSPYYGAASQYTQQAATGPGGFAAASPYLSSGAGLAGSAAQMTAPVGAQQIQQYMSPYLRNVADPTMAYMRQQQEQQMAGQLSNAIQQGAFGGDRAGLAAAALAGQQQLAGAKTYGDIMQQGYGQALQSAFQAQQAQQADLARQLQAGQALGQFGSTAGQLQQADLARRLQAGSQMGQIGTAARGAYETQQQMQASDLARQLQASQAMGGYGAGLGQLGTQMGALGAGAQQAALQGAQAQIGAGTLEQQTQQAGLQALYNQFLQQQAYPYQQAQFLANIAMGTGALSGSTNTGYTSQQSQYQPFFSDRRLKDGVDADEGENKPEIIGETFDGQKIYRYRLHNPVTGELEPPQIGLMADEAEKVHPDAVGENRGFKTLDYRRATDDSADIAKGLGAARMGGAVTSSGDYARGGFASGGFDYVSPDSYEAAMERILGKQKSALGLGAVGGDIKSGPYGGSGLNLKASYVPEANLPVGKLMEPEPMRVSAPKEAPPSTMSQLGGLASSGLNLYKDVTGKSGLHEAYEALTKKSHGGLVPHYDLGGDIPYADKSDGYIPKELTQSKPVEQLKGPALPGAQDQGSKGSSGLGGMIDTAAKGIGAAKTAYDLGSTIVAALPTVAAMFSDPRLKTGVGRDGYADGMAVDPEEDNARREREIEQTLKFEGGLNPSDTNRTPSMYGINQAAHPGIDVKKLSPEQAKDIYRKEYWEGIGAANLPERIQGMAYDTAVMAGPGRARQLIKQAGDDPEKFMAARESFLNSLIERDPEKYGKYAKAWANRNETLRNQAGLGNADAVLAHLPAGAKDFYGKADETSGGVKPDTRDFGDKATDFLTSERFIIPVLTGLGAMASSPSRYLGSAILQGLGAGAGAYHQIGQQDFERQKELQNLGIESRRVDVEQQKQDLAKAEIERKRQEARDIAKIILGNGSPESLPAKTKDQVSAEKDQEQNVAAPPVGSKSDAILQAQEAEQEAARYDHMAAISTDPLEVQKFLGFANQARNRADTLRSGSPEYKQQLSAFEAAGKEYAALQSEAHNAKDDIEELKRTRSMLDNPNFSTGLLGGAWLTAKRGAAELGVPGAEEDVPDIETFNAATKKMVTDATGGSLGAGISNADRQYLEERTPSIFLQKETNRRLFDQAIKIKQRKIDVAQFQDDYIKAHGSLDKNYNEALRNWAEKHPLFSEEEKKNRYKSVESTKGHDILHEMRPELDANPKYPGIFRNRVTGKFYNESGQEVAAPGGSQ